MHNVPKHPNNITYYAIALQSIRVFIKGLDSNLTDHLTVQI